VAGKIVELEFNRTGIYYGNYSYYVLEKERRFLIEYKHYMNQQKKIERMEQQIEQYRIWGKMRDSEAMFKRAKVLEKRLEKIEVLDNPVRISKRVHFNQDSGSRTGNMVLEIGNLSKGFEEKPLLFEVELNLFYQDSACIIGKNGCGKTTLLKMILGEIQPDTGTIRTGSQVKIGYLPQQVTFQDEEQTILEYFSYHHNITYEAARSQLARGLFFKEDVHKKIKFLSGGEKSRLRLCSLTFEKVNFMVLDEPTNHLDIESREVLEKTLAEYEGTLLFVSHDRYFINKIADKIMVIENSSLKVYPGDYSYYLEELQKNTGEESKPDNNKSERAGKSENTSKPGGKSIQSEAEKPVGTNKAAGATKAVDYKTDATRKRSGGVSAWRLDVLERDIEDMEAEIKAIETEIMEHSFEAEYLRELYLKKEKIENELNQAYDTWENYQLADK
jgi:ATPase subunit of ABC transporter with duplicated ATPase domains